MKSYVYAFGAIALWSSLAFLGLSVSRVPPFLLVGITLSIGSIFGVFGIRQWKVSPRVLAVGIYGLFGYHFCLFMAFRNAPPIEANLLNYLWPLLIVLLSPVFLPNYKLNKKHFVSAILGFLGAALIVTKGRLNISTDAWSGYLLAILAAFIWSSYSLMLKRMSGIPTSAIGLYCLVSGLLSLVCHNLYEPSYSVSLDEIYSLVILGIGPMGIAFFLWDKALKLGDPRVIGALSYLTPLASTLILILFGHGSFTWISFLAMLCIIGGAIMGSVAGKSSHFSESGTD